MSQGISPNVPIPWKSWYLCFHPEQIGLRFVDEDTRSTAVQVRIRPEGN